VATAAVDILRRDCGTEISDCIVAIGPSIGPDDYEVGPELREAFLGGDHAPASVDRWFRPTGSRFTLDLWSANRDQLVSAGARPDRIFISGLSTLAHPTVFESFRAVGPRAGRMAALVIVPEPGRPGGSAQTV
jgi:copper oxidase (laccase) domain-containing protein